MRTILVSYFNSRLKTISPEHCHPAWLSVLINCSAPECGYEHFCQQPSIEIPDTLSDCQELAVCSTINGNLNPKLNIWIWNIPPSFI
jgi:hypothetical protein